ncbi:hypothetical protein ACFSEO_08625 [Agromyces cerinus subsp. nitratus]|uniref:hypothetical protein n=3 Tax=Agromyces cerinus TaxID=33878 RepID=UPI0036380A1A
MDPDVIIESYVSNVVGRLPRRQRADVGFELRSLLREELAGRADDAGRPADEAMAMALLGAFGRPQDVADRYRPAGFTIIRPADAPQFAWIALGGVALQWAITLPAAYLDPSIAIWAASAGVAGAWWAPLPAWWLTWGLGAFWWPGFLITVTIIAAAIRHRRGEQESPAGSAAPMEWAAEPAPAATSAAARRIPPQVLDRDRVNRPGLVISLAFWMLGATVLIALPWLPQLAPGLPQPLLDAFAFDPEFLQWRAPWVLVLWAVSFAVVFAELVAGRSTRTTRLISLMGGIGWLVLLTWCLAAGPIFTAPATDGVVRLCLVGIMVITAIDLVVTLRRGVLPMRAPVVGH